GRRRPRLRPRQTARRRAPRAGRRWPGPRPRPEGGGGRGRRRAGRLPRQAVLGRRAARLRGRVAAAQRVRGLRAGRARGHGLRRARRRDRRRRRARARAARRGRGPRPARRRGRDGGGRGRAAGQPRALAGRERRRARRRHPLQHGPRRAALRGALPPRALIVNLLDAILLGLVQGLTEFLPVSSSGHLVIGQTLLGVDSPGVAFEVVLHVATLLSVIIV